MMNCSPSLDRPAGFFPGGFAQGGPCATDRSMRLDRGFVADRAVWSLLVVVSTPSLAFSPRIVEAHEPVRVQAFGAELAVERFDEGIVGWLPWPREVERHTPMVGPQV